MAAQNAKVELGESYVSRQSAYGHVTISDVNKEHTDHGNETNQEKTM